MVKLFVANIKGAATLLAEDLRTLGELSGISPKGDAVLDDFQRIDRIPAGSIIAFGGGSTLEMLQSLPGRAREGIIDRVTKHKCGYLGSCAGAIAASSKVHNVLFDGHKDASDPYDKLLFKFFPTKAYVMFTRDESIAEGSADFRYTAPIQYADQTLYEPYICGAAFNKAQFDAADADPRLKRAEVLGCFKVTIFDRSKRVHERINNPIAAARIRGDGTRGTVLVWNHPEYSVPGSRLFHAVKHGVDTLPAFSRGDCDLLENHAKACEENAKALLRQTFSA